MINPLEQLRNEFLFATSTDFVGVYGDPYQVLNVHRQLGLPENLIGLEVLAWTHTLRDKFDFFEVYGHLVAGIHGRMGLDSLREPIGFTLDRLLADLPQLQPFMKELVKRFPQPRYFLVHQPEAEKDSYRNAIAQLPKDILPVIENHVHPNAMPDALNVVRSVNADPRVDRMAFHVFDLAHFLVEGVARPDLSRWDEMIRCLDQIGPAIIHLPIGTAVHDSLPFAEISPAMWRQWACVIQKHGSFVTLEYQHASKLKNVFTNPYHDRNLNDPKFLRDYDRKLDILIKHGVLDFAREKN